MTVDLNGDGGRHKAQLETEGEGDMVGSVECLEVRGRGKQKNPWLLNANLRKPVYGHIRTQRHTWM